MTFMNRRTFLGGVSTAGGLLAAAPGARVEAAAKSAAVATPRARLRTALCAYSYRTALAKKTMSYNDLVRIAVENDVDGLDLTVYWFPSQSDDFTLPLKRLAYQNGVDIYSLSIRTEMTRAHKSEQDAEVAGIAKWIEVASKMGAQHIRVFGGKVPKDATEDQAAAWCTEVLKRAADHAARAGIILGLENHGGITSRAERILEILKKVDSPWVGVNLDTGNFERDGWKQLEMCVRQAVNVQVKTQIRDAEGKPQPMDLARAVRMLATGGYRGYLAIEHGDRAGEEGELPVLMRKLNALVRQQSA